MHLVLGAENFSCHSSLGGTLEIACMRYLDSICTGHMYRGHSIFCGTTTTAKMPKEGMLGRGRPNPVINRVGELTLDRLQFSV